MKNTKNAAAKWNSIVKAIRAKYPEMCDKAVYTRARYAMNK